MQVEGRLGTRPDPEGVTGGKGLAIVCGDDSVAICSLIAWSARWNAVFIQSRHDRFPLPLKRADEWSGMASRPSPRETQRKDFDLRRVDLAPRYADFARTLAAFAARQRPEVLQRLTPRGKLSWQLVRLCAPGKSRLVNLSAVLVPILATSVCLNCERLSVQRE